MGGAREADQLTAHREPRLGLSIPTAAHRLFELPALARRAEALGWTDCWSFEVNGFDGFTPLATAAAATERLRIGVAIAPVFLRPPGLLAMHASAMADLAPGRFILGLGSSTPTVVEQWMGVPFSKPRTRTLETLRAVRALLAGEKVGGMRIAQPPAEPVPIWMAALGGRMLEAAAAEADGLCLFMTGPRYIRSLMDGAGRGLDSMCRITVIPGEREAARTAARRHITTYAIVPFYARAMASQGFAEEVEAINARWAAGDRAAAPGQVSDAMLDELVLTGNSERIGEGVERYRAAGLGCPVLAISPLSGGGEAEFERLLEGLALGRS
jgi:probable F420-dependent oxidoreductase